MQTIHYEVELSSHRHTHKERILAIDMSDIFDNILQDAWNRKVYDYYTIYINNQPTEYSGNIQQVALTVRQTSTSYVE